LRSRNIWVNSNEGKTYELDLKHILRRTLHVFYLYVNDAHQYDADIEEKDLYGLYKINEVQNIGVREQLFLRIIAVRVKKQK